MSFINIDDDQRWVPTHVQVTVLRGRGLRAKGKHGTSDVYTVIQVGKEKFTTCVVEKTTAPEWTEECSFELLPGVLEVGGQGAYPPGSSDLVLTVMHRALIGPDVFLGHVVLPLEKIFQDRICLRNEWYKLRSKTGRKEKERGELQVTVQFTRHNLTASMFDLSVKDKPRSAFGKLKDRVTGKKRGEAETSSAIVPGGYAVLSGGGRRLSGDDYAEDDEGRRSRVKSFFLKGKLRRSSDAQSSTSLASECSVTSSPGGTLSPTAGIGMLVSDFSNSPSENGNHPAGSSPVHPAQPPPKQMTHKRAFSDEASRITLPRPRAVETLLAQSGALSRSSLCINGSHVYGAESLGPGGASTLPASLGLLQKCAPLSRSLQNLGRRADDPRRSPGTGRRWSFDRAGKEEKTAQATAAPSSQAAQAPTPAVTAIVGADPASEGKKHKRSLFSHGRSESAGKGSDTAKVVQGQTLPEERHKGWFSAKDSHSKPSPHPVKPLTASAPQGGKKSEGRSVLVSGLEKLKSTIHPGRASQSDEPEAERNKSLSESTAQYDHLTNNEIVALLLQREAELEKQGEEFEKQGSLLEKRDVELKKMKLQVRDMEDYIDRLLVRIMEQTPTLLQVRSRFK